MTSAIHPVNRPASDARLVTYDSAEIAARSTVDYQTHTNKFAAKISKVADQLLKPTVYGLYWLGVSLRTGTGHGHNRGAGGASKKYAPLKAALGISVSLLTLPLTVLGLATKAFIYSGRTGKEVVRFMDATQGNTSQYQPPVLDADENMHLATFNVAGMPPVIDSLNDVLPAEKRMHEFANWLKKQDVNDLPLVIGLQESFCEKAAKKFTNETKELYPYAVTTAGWKALPLVGSNSGLQFHSRVPIISSAFYPFDNLIGAGIRCSARGFLRIELDLGAGKTAMVYVTHAQPFASKEEQKVRCEQIEGIRAQMRFDRYQDSRKGVDRSGHYYLMGDLNVANVDDVHLLDKEKNYGVIGEYDELRKEGKILSDTSFYDPYLEEHEPNGKRQSGAALFLERDVHNADRRRNGWQPIEEPKGSFYVGAAQKDRLQGGYGTKKFYKRHYPAVKACRLDYILRLRCEEDYLDRTHLPKYTGVAEIRHVIPEQIKTCAVSDHLLLSAIFRKTQ